MNVIEPMFKEEQSYLDYINEHRKNVAEVWKRVGELLVGEFGLDDYIWFSIDALIVEHDNSKYDLEEFHGYRQYFYPINSGGKDKLMFNVSWNHHYHKNKHHWEYWVMEDGFVITMPFQYVFEMLCDWSAMSLKFGGVPSEYYEKNSSKMKLAIGASQLVG